jgi:hypothetical protein
MAIKNEAGAAVNVDYYEITSSGNRLSPAGWNSLKDQNAAGFPAGNGSGNGWEESGGSSAGVLSESYLTGTSSIVNSANIGLGAGFLTGGAQDLVFRYGTPKPAADLFLTADYNSDLEVDGADLLTVQRGLGNTSEEGAIAKSGGNSDFDADVDAVDFGNTINQFGTGAGSSTLIRGLVRYVTTGPISAIPEPSTLVVASFGAATLAGARRRRN